MMRQRVTLVLLLAFAGSVLVANGGAGQAVPGFVAGAEPASELRRGPAIRATATTVAQDPAAVEAALGLDRPTRRAIQQRLRNEGFDPGTPDGLFGPRTRAAIRRWQEARGVPATGYLDGVQAERLRTADALPRSGSDASEPAAADVVESPPAAAAAGTDRRERTSEPAVAEVAAAPVTPPGAPPDCGAWPRKAFFESATAADVRACLAAGARVAALYDGQPTALHLAAAYARSPAVIEEVLAAGADVSAARVRPFRGTPLHWVQYNKNPAVVEALLAAGADVEARDRSGNTVLKRAAGQGNPAVVASLLEGGADVSAADRNGHTSLHVGARSAGDPPNPAAGGAVVEILLAAGADVEARTSDGFTPLHFAARRSVGLAAIEMLVAAGADVSARTDDGETPLQRARTPETRDALLAAGADRCELWNRSGFFEIATTADVAVCLRAGADVSARDDDGRTPLHWAAASAVDATVLDALLAAGADSTVRTGNGDPVSHFAARNENLAVLQAVLAAGADPSARDDDGVTLLHEAATNENLAVIESLLAAGADVSAQASNGDTALHIAAASNSNPAVVQALLAAGADVSARGSSGRTPLHRVASNSNPAAVVEVLVAAGADVSAAERFMGKTPMHAAVSSSNVPMVEALAAAGADATVVDRYGQPPLAGLRSSYRDHVARTLEALVAAGADVSARWRTDGVTGTSLHHLFVDAHPAVVQALLAAGASVSARDSDGRTPLHKVAGPWRAEKVEILLAAGADVSARSVDGQTPLHGAASDTIEMLLATGARLEARDQQGRTPLHHAALRSSPARLEALLSVGADPNARDADGKTPWDLAQENDRLQETDAYWRLNDARFDETPRQESRRSTPAGPGLLPRAVASAEPGRRTRACEIPGYPSPTDVAALGLNWCGSTVGFQRRAFALQAAGAWCAIAEGTSFSAGQIGARHQEIRAACDALDALGTRGGPPCRCPAGYRP